MNLPCRINHSIWVMSEVSLNLSPDLQSCLKLNSSEVDGMGAGCNVSYRQFEIVVVQSEQEVAINVG
jgi:hypothetical protein